MNFRAVFHLVSYVLLVMGVSLFACGFLSRAFGDPAAARAAFDLSGSLTLALALTGWLFTRGRMDLQRRDGLGIVSFGWLAATLAGALPYVLSGAIPSWAGAVFETMSGFTTTGASVLADPAAMPRSLLLWRALTHFYGGMGVLVLCVAILPLLGAGGMQIYRAEMPGPTKDRLAPRIATTAKILWTVYVGLCAAQILLLALGGMPWFDAVCHSFATLATGGFSTRADSYVRYSPYLQWVTTVFMVLAGVNFALHVRLLRGEVRACARDSELRFYAGVVLAAGLLLTFNIWGSRIPRFGDALRAGFFQCASILTTTGFASSDFNVWPTASQTLLVFLMFIGGCAGSTAGGIKQVRILVSLKSILKEIRLFLLPHGVFRVKLNRAPVEPDVVSAIVAFTLVFLILFALGTMGMTFFTPDMVTASTATIACLANVGPGLAVVGPMANYAGIPAGGQLLLSILMLLGRLEIFTLLVLALPAFWRHRG